MAKIYHVYSVPLKISTKRIVTRAVSRATYFRGSPIIGNLDQSASRSRKERAVTNPGLHSCLIRNAKALFKLCGCAGWSELSLVAFAVKRIFTRRASDYLNFSSRTCFSALLSFPSEKRI